MENKGLKLILIAMISLIIILIVILVIYILSPAESPVKNFIEKTAGIGNPQTEIPEEIKTPENFIAQTSSSSSSSGGSGGGSGGGAISESNPGCTLIPISYSLENQNQTSTCNSYDGEICIDKTVVCSIEVKNRDPELSGIFNLQIIFSKYSNSTLVNSKNEQIEIAPSDVFLFSASLSIQSSEESGDANQEIKCSYSTFEQPVHVAC